MVLPEIGFFPVILQIRDMAFSLIRAAEDISNWNCGKFKKREKRFRLRIAAFMGDYRRCAVPLAIYMAGYTCTPSVFGWCTGKLASMRALASRADNVEAVG